MHPGLIKKIPSSEQTSVRMQNTSWPRTHYSSHQNKPPQRSSFLKKKNTKSAPLVFKTLRASNSIQPATNKHTPSPTLFISQGFQRDSRQLFFGSRSRVFSNEPPPPLGNFLNYCGCLRALIIIPRACVRVCVCAYARAPVLHAELYASSRGLYSVSFLLLPAAKWIAETAGSTASFEDLGGWGSYGIAGFSRVLA